jgi:tetratricopeptide (TPR) repeat protein
VTFRFSKAVKWIWLTGAALGLIWVMGVGSVRDERAQRFHLQALQAGLAGDVDSAEASERRALDFAPRYATAWNTLAYLSDFRAQKTVQAGPRTALIQRAADFYREALKCAPQDVVIRENQIEFYMENHAWGRALELQRELTAEAPSHLPNYDRQAKILLALHKPQEAVATCELALQKKSTYLPAALIQVEAFRSLGRPDRALVTAKRVLGIQPDEMEPTEMKALREKLAVVVRQLSPSAKE